MKDYEHNGIHYQLGIPEIYRHEAVRLFDEAFGPKFAVAIKNETARLKLLTDSLCLSSAFGAVANGSLVGLAGFNDSQGSLTKGITMKRLIQSLGVVRGAWAIGIFILYERKASEGELLMDGIAVRDNMRGHGIGTQLLSSIQRFGKEKQYTTIRLDVIDTNSNAKRLYEKMGFVATETVEFAYLRWLLGFGASTTLVYHVPEAAKTGLGIKS